MTKRAAGGVLTSVPRKPVLLPLLVAAGLSACGGSHVAPRAAATQAAPPTRWVGTHGIEVAVPRSWPDNRGTCGTPQANTVLWNEDGILDCLVIQPLGLSAVEFGGVVPRPTSWYRRHTTLVTIDGVRARRWFAGTVRGSREVQLVFPRRDIAVTVLSPHRSLLRRIVASIRLVRVDKNGCPTRPAGDYRLGSRPSTPPPFVPKGAVHVVACSYQGHWLDRSNMLGPRAAERLARALDAAPGGLSRAPRSSYLPSVCAATWRGSVIVARFKYRGSRPPVTVTAHIDGCSRLGASNGRWAVRITPRWVMRLVDDARYSGDFPDPRSVR